MGSYIQYLFKMIRGKLLKLSKLLRSHSQKFFKTSALKNFGNFNRKHLCWSLFLIKLHD